MRNFAFYPAHRIRGACQRAVNRVGSLILLFLSRPGSDFVVTVRAGAETRPYNISSKTIPGFKSKVSHYSLRDSLRVGTRKKGPSNDGPVCFLFLFFFVDGDGDAEVGKLKVIDRGGALGHRFGRVLHFRIGNHVTKRLRLQHLHAKPVKP